MIYKNKGYVGKRCDDPIKQFQSPFQDNKNLDRMVGLWLGVENYENVDRNDWENGKNWKE